MGWFSSKKVTTVGTTVSRVIEDDQLPNSIEMGIFKGIFADDPDNGIVPHMLEEMFSSIAVRSERMYDWAKDNYVHGLPSGLMHGATQGRPEVQAVLDAIHGESVLLDYMQVGSPNNLHIGWMKLITDYGYDPVTNILGPLSAAKGHTVYLKDMVVTVPTVTGNQQPGAFTQWGSPAKAGYTAQRPAHGGPVGLLVAHSPVVVDALATEDYLNVTVTWSYMGTIVDGEDSHWGRIVTDESFKIFVTGYVDDADYFHAKFSTADGGIHYWMYQAGLGTYPSLDEVFDDPPPSLGTFYPFGYFRFGETQENEDDTTEGYRDGKKLTKYLGMDFDAVCDAVAENPDIDDVEQAMLIMAVPANTTDPMERRYLFEFFDRLFSLSGAQFTNPVTSSIVSTLQGNPDLTRSTITIADARFKMALTNSGIYKKRVAAKIGDGSVGQFDSGTRTEVVTNTYRDLQTNEMTTQLVNLVTHWYRRQVSHTICEEIQVVGLKMLYHIYGDYKATADDTDDILLIPIDKTISGAYTMPQREQLYARALHYVFNSMVVTKVKWYQQEWFADFMFVVSVLLIAYTLGTSAPWVALLTATTTAAVTAAAYALLIPILKGLILSYALKLIVKAIGGEIAIIIGVLVTAYLAYSSMQTGGVKGAPWGQQLLALGNGLVSAVKAHYADQMGDLLDEKKAFDIEAETKTGELEAAQALLETDSFLTPLFIPGEKPAEYFSRTVHAGNVGATIGLAAVTNYVSVALTLPTLDETMFKGDSHGDAQPAF